MAKDLKIWDVAVIGCGAAGMMAAITAADKKSSVLVLDHASESGKKILSTGNGRCNITNEKQGTEFYNCSDPAFVLNISNAFSAEDTVKFFNKLGILTKSRNGYVYPRNDQASVVRDVLLKKIINDRNITLKNDIGIRLISKENDVFVINTKSGDFHAKTCIMACGGKTLPKSGSDGSGYIYAKKLGHKVNDTYPALTALCCNLMPEELSGVRADAAVTLYIDGKIAAYDIGEIQFTKYGISGIPVFQVSRHAAIALAKHSCVQAVIDLLPEYSTEEVRLLVEKAVDFEHFDPVKASEGLSGLLNSKLARYIAEYTCQSSNHFAEAIKELAFDITEAKGFDFAQVTAGGIDVNEIDAYDMQSKLVDGLYFAGEMIDVDGLCGGYNLQFAWATGHIAGEAAHLKAKLI